MVPKLDFDVLLLLRTLFRLDRLWTIVSANHAPLCHSAISIRNPRKAFENVFLEGGSTPAATRHFNLLILSLPAQIFMLANILVELPWNTIAGAVLFFCWYYP